MTKTNPSDWVFFATGDIQVAKDAFAREIYHLACFHAQQAAEKLLKACLVQQGKSIPKVHS